MASDAVAALEQPVQTANQQNVTSLVIEIIANSSDVAAARLSPDDTDEFLLPDDTLDSELLEPVPIPERPSILRPVRYDSMTIFRARKTAHTEGILERYASKVDVWRQGKDDVEFASPAADAETIRQALEQDGGRVEMRSGAKLQQAIDQETERLRRATRNDARRAAAFKWMSDNAQYFARLAQTDDWFAEYHTYDDIVWWSGDLAARFPHLVRFVPSIGRTHEGRDIPMLRITAPGGDGGKERKRVWLQSLQHAREWISGSTLQYIAEKLVGGYGKHSRVTRLLKQVEFVLVPVVNPDGYTYTWTTDRLWRKNRRDNGDGTFGVDLNRNWPDHWSSKGLWTQSSSVIYPGPSAASEPEVQALMQAYLKTPNVVAVVDIHSYSQLLLRPFGWGRTLDAGERQYREVADQLVKDLALARGSRYTSEHAVDLYQAKGIAIDWWAGAGQQKRQADSARAGSTRPYAFTLELSPKDDEELGDSGFVLPPSAIRKVGEDVWPMILHLAEIGLTQPLVSRAGAT